MPHKPAAVAMNTALRRLILSFRWFVANQPPEERIGLPTFLSKASADLDTADKELVSSFDKEPVEGGTSAKAVQELAQRLEALEKKVDNKSHGGDNR